METSTFQDIHPTDLATNLSSAAPQSDFDVLRIPLGLDVSELNTNLEKARTEFPWQIKDEMRGYQALGLQYSNAEDVFSDAVNATTPERPFRMFDKTNVAGKLFDSVVMRVYPLRLFRSRLLSADGGLVFPGVHNDGATAVRLHIPILTNPDAWMEIDGRRYHLPADGSGYLVNTSRMHRIGNDGTTNRTHLVSVIYPDFPSFLHPFAQSALIRLIDSPAVRFKKHLVTLTTSALAEAGGKCTICNLTRQLHAIPISPTELKAACAQCIEDVGRLAFLRRSNGDEAINDFQNEFRNSAEVRAAARETSI